MASDTCKTCVFFEDQAPKIEESGLCRANPPLAHSRKELEAFWPVVTVADWCGQHVTSRAM